MTEPWTEPDPDRRLAAGPAAVLRVGTRDFPIEPDRIYVIGSGERADLRIVHESVAPYHATFSAHGGGLRLEDLGGESGTFVGDMRVHGTVDVPPGSRIRVGGIELGVEPPGAAAAPTAHSPVHREDSAFAEMMAEELRRAPWFAASLLLHVAVFLLLWLLATPEPVGQRTRREFGVDSPAEQLAELTETSPAPEPFTVEEQKESELDLQDVQLEALREEIEQDLPAFDEPTSFGADAFGKASMFDRIGGTGGADVLQSIGGGGEGSGFRSTVEGLRESGLEIVFVFDSTGSMGPVLAATKARMTRMLEALVALVPDARVGVVTYRDRGSGEDYLTRGVPLARDLYRSINFMQTVEAGGGGDRPEAVLDGLTAAIEQRWRPKARRVVVLIGDAPAHQESERKIDALVRRFTHDGHSFVHAITTAPDILGGIDPRTKKSFEGIAKAGKGVCLPFEREETILRQVLTLAIGTDFREQVDRVYELLETREIPVSRTVRQAVERADRDRIVRLLSLPTVPPELMQLLSQSRDLDVAEVLISALTDAEVPEEGRQAAAFALQSMLSLTEPPIRVESARPIPPAEAKRLHELARKTLR